MINIDNKERIFPRVESNPPGQEIHFQLGERFAKWWTTPSGENGDACVDSLREAELFAVSQARILGYVCAKTVNCDLCGKMGISIDPKVVSCRGYDNPLVQWRWQERVDKDSNQYVGEGISMCPTVKFFKGAGEVEEDILEGNQVRMRLKSADVPLAEKAIGAVLVGVR